MRAAERSKKKEEREYQLKREDQNLERMKLAEAKETKDDIDSYLRHWNGKTWAVNLSALLRGRVLVLYSLLPQERALDYATLKAALLKRFEKTEDGFRQQFRRCRPERGEIFTQFSVR